MNENLRRVLTWYWLLHKRLLRKGSFLLILLLIPVMAGLISLSADGEGGAFIRVAVSAEDPAQPVYRQIANRLMADSRIIVVEEYADAPSARRAVEAAQVDTAWIFGDDLDSRLDAVTLGGKENLVQVVTAEGSTFESTTRERLYGAIFPEIAYRVYSRFSTETLSSYAELTDTQLQEAFDTVFTDTSVIQFEFLHSVNDTLLEDAQVMTAPLRGLMAVVLVFCGMAATMYFLRDEETGVFAVLSVSRRLWVLWGNGLAATGIGAVFVTGALLLSGLYTTVLYETVSMLCMVLMTVGFCSLLGALCHHNRFMGAVLPVVLIGSVAFSPVFYNIRGLTGPQVLFPTFYYLYSVNDLSFVWYALAYAVVAFAATGLVYGLTRRVNP